MWAIWLVTWAWAGLATGRETRGPHSLPAHVFTEQADTPETIEGHWTVGSQELSLGAIAGALEHP